MKAPVLALVAASFVCAPLAAARAVPLAAEQTAAQQTDTVLLTLDEALAIARGANPTYLRAENQLGLDAPEARATWLGQILPTVDLTLLSTGYSGRLTRIGEDNFGNPVPNPSAEWSYNSSTNQSVSLTWSVQGASLFTAKRQLDQSRQGRALALSTAGTQLGADVRRQYQDALQQRMLLEVEETLAEARATDLASTERLFELARATQVDVLNAQLQVEQQQLAIQQQRRAHEQALLLLGTTLGDAELPPFRIEDPGFEVFDPTELDEDALVARALRDSPSVLEARSQVEGARLGRHDAGAYKWPSLSANYNLSRFVSTPETDALFDVSYEPDQVQSSFQVQLSVPFLNNYFQNRYNEVQAGVQLDNQRQVLRQQELDSERSVREALINLRNLHESYGLAVRSQDIAARATELAREEYRLGARTFQELQQAVEQEGTARRQVIQARFSFLDAVLALESAVGGPVGPGAGAGG
jgi:outer membrane protein TolC